MGRDFRDWWHTKGAELWAEAVDKDILGAIEMVFKAGSWRAEGPLLMLVPMHPTKEMIVAAELAIESHKDSDWDSGGDGESHNSYEYFTPGVEIAVWKAMINAAPKP